MEALKELLKKGESKMDPEVWSMVKMLKTFKKEKKERRKTRKKRFTKQKTNSTKRRETAREGKGEGYVLILSTMTIDRLHSQNLTLPHGNYMREFSLSKRSSSSGKLRISFWEKARGTPHVREQKA